MTAVEMPALPGEVERQYPVIEVARHVSAVGLHRIDDGTFTVSNFGTGKSKRRVPASSINAFIMAHTYGNKKPVAATTGQSNR